MSCSSGEPRTRASSARPARPNPSRKSPGNQAIRIREMTEDIVAKRVAVFGGSQVDRDSDRYREAYEVGARLARAGITVVNGGYTGTMEASARGAREAGGRVIGVTSTFFPDRDVNEYIDEVIPTDDLYSRIREL